jgi:hypothetical protein
MFEPKFLNIEFIFNQVLGFFKSTIEFVVNISGGNLFIPQIKIFLSIVSILFITIIIYSIIRLWELKKEDIEKYSFVEPVDQGGGEKHERWEVVQTHIESNNQSDWKLAIIEADSILDDMVKKIGYSGDNLGERLKSIEVSDFTSIQSAWEAHKVRNQIAHEGSGFELTHREAKRVIGLYKSVFEEFEYI